MAEPGTGLIARNALAAAQWELALASSESGQRGSAWLSRDIVGFSRWLGRYWESARLAGLPEADRCLLSVNQADRLWQRIIEESDEGESLLSARGMTGLAREARRLLHDYGEDGLSASGPAWSGDSAAFLRWNRSFEGLLRRRGWIDADSLLFRINRLPRTPAVGPLMLLDPTPGTPERLRWQEGLQKSGGRCDVIEFDQYPTRPRSWLASDPAAELGMAFEWVSRELQRQPQQRLAIVVPDLASRLDEVRSALSGGDHELYLAGGSVANLRNIGLVGAAASALGIILPGSGFGNFSRWLRSPFFATEGSDEVVARIALECWLREDPRADSGFTENYLQFGLRQEIRQRAPSVARRLDDALQTLPRQATATGWAEALQRYLRALGWLGFESPLPDAIRDAWDRTWSALSELTAITGMLDAAAAVREFERVLQQQSLYRPVSDRGVHVLRSIDELGPGYAGAWVTGFTDLSWPPSPVRNPLIPWAVRKRLGFTGTDPMADLDLARREFARVCASVPDIVFSCPTRVEDQPQVPNPNFRDWAPPPRGSSMANSTQAANRARLGARSWETLTDPAPPLTERRIPGGTGTLDWQARNPVIAFCIARLGARPLELPRRGIDPRRRGILLHRALELACRPAHTGPSAASPEAAVAAAVEKLLPPGNPVWMVQIQSEVERLLTLMHDYLRLEEQRAPFTIRATEQAVSLEIDGRELRCRIDRIDDLAGGESVVIDYKSSRRPVSGWFSERLNDCQLPVYAQHLRPSVAAIAVAALAPDGVDYRAAGTCVASLPGRHRRFDPAAWEAQLLRWQQQITTLINEFVAGDVRASAALPARGEEAFASLTRIRELLQ